LSWSSLLWWGNLVTTHNVKELLTLSSFNSIVWLSGVVKIEVSFDPLAKFKVVLIFGFYELIYLYVSLDAILIKCTLQDFVILNVFIVKLSAPFDFGKVECTWEDCVHNLTVY
jgi:hypothetical protein